MYNSILYITFIGLFLHNNSTAQHQVKDMTVQEYLDKYKDIAIQEMERSGIPASITLAQGIHESAFGNSELAKKSNNHFGIKCGSKWSGKGFYKWDDDPQKSCFRVYESAEQSYVDHSDFLMNRTRYAFLFEYERHEYKKWAKGLRKAGYATDPKYPDKLIHSIEKYNLTQYDLETGQLAFEDKNNKEPIAKTATLTYRSKPRSFLFRIYKAGLFRENGSTYAISRKGESALAVAKRFGIPYHRFLKFNDLKDGDLLIDFQPTYIQPKKSSYRGDEVYYTVSKDITMYEIAQCFGVRLSSLLHKNMLQPGEEPQNGAKIYLKDKAPQKPALRSFAHIDTLPSLEIKKETEVVPQKTISKIEDNTSTKVSLVAIDMNSPVYTPDVYADTAHLNTSLVSKDSIISFTQAAIIETDKAITNTLSSISTTTDAIINKNALFVPSESVNSASEPTNSDLNTATTTDIAAKTVTYQHKQHTVKQGETLYRLHRLYNVSVEAIKQANQLYDNAIVVGERLTIPASSGY